MIQSAIARAVGRENLSGELARASMEQILSGEATAAQIAALAIALRMKGETAEEIAGMAEAMRARVPQLRTRRSPLMDTCGTGGGNSAGTSKFNISTTVAIVTASCGVAVAKHGNRAVTSRTGSADVLEALGVRVDLTPENEIMGLKHRDHETWGVQFHPESVLTRPGLKLIENFLTLCRQQRSVPR